MVTLKADVVMLGIGLSTCSLAMALLKKGYRGHIVMLEKERDVDNNKTWCFWEGEYIPTYLRPIVSKTWASWKIADTIHAVTTGDQGYSCIKAVDFFSHCLETFKAASNVTLVFEADVTNTGHNDRCVTACYDGYLVEATIGFDSRHHMPSESMPDGMLQCFSGAWVSSSSPLFSDNVADLMVDMKTIEQGIEFIYVLPFDVNYALIEVTQFSSQLPSKTCLEEKVLSSVGNMGLMKEDIVSWEHGVLPMATENIALSTSQHGKPPGNSGWQSIGIRGHNIRAATGYAFISIQRASEHFAQQIIKGGAVTPFKSPRRYHWLDKVFLKVLRNRPDMAVEIFSRMARGTSPEQFSRFMTERATVADIVSVISSMPKRVFLSAAIGMMR